MRILQGLTIAASTALLLAPSVQAHDLNATHGFVAWVATMNCAGGQQIAFWSSITEADVVGEMNKLLANGTEVVQSGDKIYTNCSPWITVVAEELPR